MRRTGKHKWLWLAAVTLLAAAAAVFQFALIGYTFTALVLLGAAVLIVLFHMLGKCRSRWPERVLAGLVLAGCVVFAALEIPVISAAGGNDRGGADYLIVLGAGVNGTTPSLSLRERLEAAERYLAENPGCTAIVTGGRGPGEEITEAQAMCDYLVSHGVDESRVIMEERAASTEENLQFSFELIRARGDEPGDCQVAVVSSEYHLCRAAYLAQEMGVAVTTLAARTSYFVLRMNYFIREGFAMAYLRVFGS